MSDESILVGRVLRSSTADFTIGTKLLEAEVPKFGHFVKVLASNISNGQEVIGLISNVLIDDDPFVRQLIIPGVDESIIADHRENRLYIQVSVLVVGYSENGRMHQYLPAQPPSALEKIVTCSPAEVQQFIGKNEFTFFRTVLNAKDVPSDELLAASIRAAAEVRSGAAVGNFLVDAGRELSRLLAFDAARLEGLLRRIHP